ncbi:MAG TPA: ribosome maturation factor RimM [Alphaproteobacteria bacterium]|jgi:16S rRNA processing protein RimM
MAEARICVGVIGAPRGVRGELRIKSYTAEPAALAGYGALTDESGRREFRVRVLDCQGDMLVARIEGVEDRDAAEALKGVRLYVARAALPAPGEDEYYEADLIGLAAETVDGTALGTVRAVKDFGAGPLLELVPRGGRPVLVPFTRAVVPVVDLAGRRVVVDPPPGLLDGDEALDETLGEDRR